MELNFTVFELKTARLMFGVAYMSTRALEESSFDISLHIIR
jgi:hypothetical protein